MKLRKITRKELLKRYAAGDQDFSGVDLSGMMIVNHFRYIDWSGIDLSGIDLSGSNLDGINFSGANLSGANLSRIGAVGRCPERSRRVSLPQPNLRRTASAASPLYKACMGIFPIDLLIVHCLLFIAHCYTLSID